MAHRDKSGLNWIIGAGIVGADIGTSVFYSTGVLFPVVGYLAPFCILFVCLMMWFFKSTYQEGLAMSPYNGGAYSMILRTIGRRAGVLAGGLTFISYLATAAVSALSGGHYLTSLFPGVEINNNVVVLLSFIPIILFGLLNIRGIKEPAKLVTGIAGFHFGLLILMGLWGLIFLLFNDIDWQKLTKITVSGHLSFPMIVYGLAAAFLGITGFESAAQIVEELEDPINKTLQKLYTIVVVLVSFTAPLISFLCLVILSEQTILDNKEFLLSGLAFSLGGPILLYVIVIDATLTLFAAVNTAFVGFIGLATTMAKQGNLPDVLLTRLSHRYPSVQGYPLICIPFMIVALLMSALVAGKIDILAEVYGMAFLGVMVSFCLGVVLMRNRPLRRGIPKEYLSTSLLQFRKVTIPLIPVFSGLLLLSAQIVLIFSAPNSSRSMLLELLSLVVLVMAFFRWGQLENRLETRDDLRLGLGKFKTIENLPNDLPKFVVCVGGTNARRLITRAVNHSIDLNNHKPFELIIFHVEEDQHRDGFEAELLQRVVSQQIAPVYSNDFILRVKLLPGNLIEGLATLKKAVPFDLLLIGKGRHPEVASQIALELEEELEVKVSQIS